MNVVSGSTGMVLFVFCGGVVGFGFAFFCILGFLKLVFFFIEKLLIFVCVLGLFIVCYRVIKFVKIFLV